MNKKMEDIDCYYNSIIEYMEGERIKDRERLITFKNEVIDWLFLDQSAA